MAFEDLLKDSSFPLDNKNYFNLVITDLNISTAYPLQFRWKYEDGSFGPWSVAKTIATSAESFPNVPSTLTVANDTAGYLEITWNGNSSTGAALTNFDRVDIYINGAPFDGAKAALSFFSAGTKTIVAPAGTYIVSAFAVSKIGTLSAMNTAVTRTITSAVPAALASATPSTPTVSSVLGAIQVSWDGKQSDGSSQPYGFNAAKVYVGTSAGFTPSASNQVDILNFANGQNTLNIGVGTIVNSVALTYGVDYYVKIATTNGTDTSTAVSATGNPVQIGKVTSGDIVTINADKIATGTLAAGSTITVGSTAGKHVVIAGTGDPLTIYGSGGLAGGAILSFNGAKLSIVGDGTFSGNLAIGSTSTASVFKAEPATGIWLGDQTYASAPFSVSTNGVIKANSGTIGGWTLASTYLQSNNVQIDGANGIIYAGPTGGAHIRISSGGLASYTGGTANNVLNIAANGQITATNVTLSGAITATSGSFTGTINANAGYLGNSSTGWLIDSDKIYNNAASSEGVTVLYTSPNFAGFSSLVGGIMLADNGFQAKYAVKLFAGGSSSSNSFWKSQGNMSPASDGGYTVGSSSWKWSAIWSYTGTIQTSDQRLKTNILNSNLGLNFINALNPVSYKWIVGGKNPIYDKESNSIISVEDIPGQRTHYGFMAQQVKEALDLVAPGQDFSGWVLTDKDDPESEQALRYEEFIAPIVKSIQELSQRLDVLEG
jgi:hypothetical protein